MQQARERSLPSSCLRHELDELPQRVVGAGLGLLDSRYVLGAGDHDVVGQSLGADPAAVVADHRDRLETPGAAPRRAPRSRCASCPRWTARAARRRASRRRSPGERRSRRYRCRWRSRSGSRSPRSGRSPAEPCPPRPPSGSRRRRPSHRSPSPRCRAPAACHPARSSRAARSPHPAAHRGSRSASGPATRRSQRPSCSHRATHVLDDRLQLAAPARPGTDTESSRRRRRAPGGRHDPRAVRGGRRTRAPAPTARGRASRRAPGERSHRRSEARTPTPPRSARRRSSGIRAGARAPPRGRPRSTSSSWSRNAITMSSSRAIRSSWQASSPPSAVRAMAGKRALANDHGMDELDRHVPRIRSRRR